MEKQKYNVTNFLHIYKRSNYHNFVYLKRIDAQLQKKMTNRCPTSQDRVVNPLHGLRDSVEYLSYIAMSSSIGTQIA